jgi:hypothetical protein
VPNAVQCIIEYKINFFDAQMAGFLGLIITFGAVKQN